MSRLRKRILAWQNTKKCVQYDTVKAVVLAVFGPARVRSMGGSGHRLRLSVPELRDRSKKFERTFVIIYPRNGNTVDWDTLQDLFTAAQLLGLLEEIEREPDDE